ncbi:hypothetical protein D3C76_1326840 [compost metagenome]
MLAVQRVGAGNIHRINHVGLRQRFQRVKEVFDRIVGAKGLRLFELTRIDGGQPHLAAFVSRIDKTFGDPVGADNSKANHG